MKFIFRVIIIFIVVPAIYYFVFLISFSLIPLLKQHWISCIIPLLCAVGIGWYVWKKLDSVPQELITSILLGAVIIGSIGFLAGFFGPLIFMPGANQGPLLGIFFAGPLGFMLGGVGGLLYWMIRKEKVGTITGN